MANVERVDLKIIDPDTLRPKKKKGRDSTTSESTGMGEDEYQASDEERDVGGIESKLQIKLVCRHGTFRFSSSTVFLIMLTPLTGVTKNHFLHLGTSEFLRAEVDPNTTPSSFSITAKSLRDMLDHFSLISTTSSTGIPGIKGDNQLGWMFGKKEVRVKSWEGAAGVQTLITEIKVDVGEFDEYWVEEERVDLTLPMKEFKVSSGYPRKSLFS
jgi:cell cycle checkpoint control protein RAD9A